MDLKLERFAFPGETTIGKLFIDGEFFCYTLEDKIREVKIPAKTAIPAGIYKVILNFSNRFQTELPLLLDVPNFTGIRIHAGNTIEDTDGCILVGKTWAENSPFIGNSRKALEALLVKLRSTESPISIEIVNMGDMKDV